MAWWDRDQVRSVEERQPIDAMCAIEMRRPTLLVVEQFRLYPSHAQTLTGSVMGTSQMIGALAWWCYHNETPMYLQPASIKIPTRALIHVNNDATPPGSVHAQDAFLHGYHWLHRGRNLDQPGTIFTGRDQT